MSATFYRSLTPQTGQVGGGSQSAFPAPFFQTNSTYATVANGGRATSTSGYDTRPNTSTALAYDMTFELVPGTYNATSGFMEMWILNSTIADGTPIYLSTGDSSLTTDGSSTSTWPSAHKGVYHFPNGSSLTLADSTSNANNLTGTNTPTAATGQVDGGMNLVKTSTQYATSGSNIGISGSTAKTIEVTINATTIPAVTCPIQFGVDSPQNDNGIFLNVLSSNDIYFAQNDNDFYTATNVVGTGAFYSIAIVYDGGVVSGSTAHIYVNGVSKSLSFGGVGGTPNTTNTTLAVGRDAANAGREFNGIIDEVRISNTNYSANYIATRYNSQSNNTAFWTLGSEVPVSTGKIPKFDNYYRQRRAA